MQVDLFPDCSYGQIDADLVIHPSDDSFSDPIVLPRDADQPPNLPRAATVRGKLPFGIARSSQQPARRSARGFKKQKEPQGSGSEEEVAESQAPVSAASAASFRRNPAVGCICISEIKTVSVSENSTQEFSGLQKLVRQD